MTRSIHDIWSAVISGDAKAWRELVDLYAALVFTVARRAGLTDDDAEDCSQQVWLALYRRRKSIKDPAALPAWLIRTTHRRALTMFARKRKQSTADELQQIASARLPDEEVNSIQESALLSIALQQLDPRCRDALTQLYFTAENRRYDQIARSLQVKANSLGPLRSRCLRKLKKILENLGWQVD